MEIDNGILDLNKEDDDFMQISSSNNIINNNTNISNSNNVNLESENNDQNQNQNQSSQPPKIRVVVRKRPIFRKEAERGENDIADVDMENGVCIIHEPKHKVDLTKYTQEHQFNFDECLDQNVDNEQIYTITVKPLVDTLFNQGKATVFAYGQTGSGKTYTMMPLPVRAAQDILKILKNSGNIVLVVSCFEIYGSKLFDLLNRRRELKMLEDGKGRVNVKGLKEMIITQIDALQDVLAQSQAVRSTGSTGANQDSSRSHSIMQFSLREILGDGQKTRQLGKLSFIDLAGSERGADTFNNDQQTRMEGAEINKSLLALKECIRGLDSGQRHVPFRGSKLTQVLSDSFVGDNSRTVMIATISPNSKSCEHTLNTLRYADRVKELRNEQSERGATKVTPSKIISQNKDAYGNLINKASPEKKIPQENSTPENLQQDQTAQFKNQSKSEEIGRTRLQHQLLQQQLQQQQNNIQQQQNQQVQQQSNKQQSSVPMIVDDNSNDVIMDAQDEDADNSQFKFENLVLHHRQYVEGCMDMVRNELELITQIDKGDISIAEYVHALEQMLNSKQNMISIFNNSIQEFKQKNVGKPQSAVQIKKTTSGNHSALRSGRRKK